MHLSINLLSLCFGKWLSLNEWLFYVTYSIIHSLQFCQVNENTPWTQRILTKIEWSISFERTFHKKYFLILIQLYIDFVHIDHIDNHWWHPKNLHDNTNFLKWLVACSDSSRFMNRDPSRMSAPNRPDLAKSQYMMTSSNGNIFRVTGPLCGEFTGPVNSPHKGQWRGALMFSLICARINDWVNNREAGDLRHYRGHYDVIVMIRNRINSGYKCLNP